MGEPLIEHEPGVFFYEENGERLAEMTYEERPEFVVIDHTRVDDRLRGRGIGQKLVEAGVEWARREHRKIVPTCTFAKALFERKADWGDVLFRR